MNHLLLHCSVAKALWSMIFSLFGVEWAMPRSIKELFLSWSLYKRRRNFAWEAAPLGVCWTVRRKRNRRVFDNVERTMEQLKNDLLRTLFSWCCETLNSIPPFSNTPTNQNPFTAMNSSHDTPLACLYRSINPTKAP